MAPLKYQLHEIRHRKQTVTVMIFLIEFLSADIKKNSFVKPIDSSSLL